MLVRALLIAAALTGSALALGPGAAAQSIQPNWIIPHQNQAERRGQNRHDVQAQVLPLRTLINIVQSQRGGQFVDVVGDLRGQGPGAFYIFRWRYPNGVEENIRVNAVTGRVG